VKIPQVSEIIHQGKRSFKVVWCQTVEGAINSGGTVGRANPIQQAHGIAKGDIYVQLTVREITWKPKFKAGDRVEGQRYGKGPWINGIVISLPTCEQGMYWITDQENPDLTVTRVKIGGLGEIKGFGVVTQFYEKEMRAR